MKEKLNLVEILKDCPKGTKLYSTVFGEVEFDYIENDSSNPINVKSSYGIRYNFTIGGELYVIYNGECTLFPSKEQRDWSKFTAPWCNLEKQDEQEKQVHFPKFTFDDTLALQCCMETVKKVQEDKELYEKLNLIHSKIYDAYWFEKQDKKDKKASSYMKAINDAGYKCDAKKKELNKKDKFDPKTLKPFDKVLARLNKQGIWYCELLSFVEGDTNLVKCCGAYYQYCIPYNEDTKHLVGTTEEAPEYYRYWED